jgi:purine-binding chemotaxis protein CheW
MNTSADSVGPSVHLVAVRAGQRFSLPVPTVREVLAMPGLDPVPLAPPEILGTFQLRGEIMPAILLDEFLAIGATATVPAVLALLRDGDASVALAFDRVLGVVPVNPGTLIPHPLAPRRPWMASLRVDPRYQLVTVLDGPALIAALVERITFTASSAGLAS